MDCIFRPFDYSFSRIFRATWKVSIVLEEILTVSNLLRYKEILVSLMEAVLRKVQMHHNMEELQDIDNEAIDDDVRI